MAALLGLTLTIYLIINAGADSVGRAMLLIGWWLVPITLFHVIPMSFSALSWRELLPRSSGLSIIRAIWIRWIREAVNALLPVAGVGGDVVGARLAALCGVPSVQAAGSMVVDVTVGVATQLLFVVIGVALLLTRSAAPEALKIAEGALVGVGLFAAAIVILLRAQHRGIFVGSVRFVGGALRNERLSGMAGGAYAVDDSVRAIYWNRLATGRASLLRLVGWVVGTGEIWLVMWSLGRPIGMTNALILESLGAGVRAAAFMVPGAFGILEGGFVLFGAVFGLPANIALVLPLCRRVRELVLGIPGLLVWYGLEGSRLLRPYQENAPPPVPQLLQADDAPLSNPLVEAEGVAAGQTPPHSGAMPTGSGTG